MNRLLLVDDMEADRVLYGTLYELASRVFHGEIGVDFASSIEEADIVIARGDTSVAVVDLAMQPDGPKETIDKLRDRRAKWPPFVVLTGAEYLPELRLLSFAAGAQDFLLKKEFNRHPESGCERIYHAFLRSQNHAA
jgi:CheY-like chemotaxis protein